MAPKRPTGNHPANGNKIALEEADALNRVVAKLSVLGDFFKHSGDDSFLLESDTPLGLYLIVGECIDALKKIGGGAKEE